jgi:hypothetical protein
VWSLYAGDCLYLRIRKGEAVPDELHLCTLNPGGFIETQDGARIRLRLTEVLRGEGEGATTWLKNST